MLQIYKSILKITTIEVYVEQVCQPMLSKNMQLYIGDMPIHVLKKLGGLRAQLLVGREMR